MFVVTEEDEAAIRAVYQQRGEFAAVVELRRRFPGSLASPPTCSRHHIALMATDDLYPHHDHRRTDIPPDGGDRHDSFSSRAVSTAQG
jgi:hypothetical protein